MSGGCQTFRVHRIRGLRSSYTIGFRPPSFCFQIRVLDCFALFRKFLGNGLEYCQYCFTANHVSTGSTKCPHSGGPQG